MRPTSAVLALLLLSPIATLAQNSSGSLQSGSLQSRPVLPAVASGADDTCPVAVQAQQQSSGRMLDAAPPGAGPSKSGEAQQNLDLLLRNREYRDVLSLDFEVRGTRPRGVVVPVGGPMGVEAVRRIHLVLGLGASESAHSALTLRNMSSIQSIAIVSVTYRDGAIWKPASLAACRTVPDPFMLVAQER